jgi:hypothetical protein
MQAQFFGKRGMPWHGAAVYHLPQQYTSSSTVPTELSLLFYDHIVSNDTMQDMWSIASLIEAIMMRIRRDLPHVKDIVLVSDNSGCYQSQVLPALLPFLASTVGLQIIFFLHSEVQDGKSIADAHFALSMLHVNRFVKAGQDVTTPAQLVAAQRSCGGLENSAAKLVLVNRSSPGILRWMSVKPSNKMLTRIGRHNEVANEQDDDYSDEWDGFPSLLPSSGISPASGWAGDSVSGPAAPSQTTMSTIPMRTEMRRTRRKLAVTMSLAMTAAPAEAEGRQWIW